MVIRFWVYGGFHGRCLGRFLDVRVFSLRRSHRIYALYLLAKLVWLHAADEYVVKRERKSASCSTVTGLQVSTSGNISIIGT